MNFSFSGLFWKPQPETQLQQSIPLNSFGAELSCSQHPEKENLLWLNQSIRDVCRDLKGNNKENEFHDNTFNTNEFHDIHVELKELLDFYVETRPWIPSPIHVQCKIYGQWQTLVFQEISDTVETSLKGKESNGIALKGIKNLTVLHENLKEVPQKEFS